MPETKERDLWWAFLAGKPETEWNPPRKPKQTTGKGGRFRQGMRAFAHEDGLYEESTFAGSSQEVWRVKDEGEVELALRVDPIESLPTPSSTPAPPDLSLGDEPHTLPAVDAVITPTKPKVPTPTLLRLIDQVCCDPLLSSASRTLTFLSSENGSTSSDVLHPLDELSSNSRPAFPSFNGNACPVDIRPSIPSRGLHFCR